MITDHNQTLDQSQLQDYSSNPTLANYLLDRLYQLGIEAVFGIPGDYSFPLCDAVCFHKKIRWTQTSNEFNAAYAASGYSRAKGFGAVCTTFGVGELSTLSAIGGAFAERDPVFHIVGQPMRAIMDKGLNVHHSLNNHNFDAYHQATKQLVCDSAMITLDKGPQQIDRIVQSAINYRKPVYIAMAFDECDAKINFPMTPLTSPFNPYNTSRVLLGSGNSGKVHFTDSKNIVVSKIKNIQERITQCKKGVIIVGYLVHRYQLLESAQKLIEESGMPFTLLANEKNLISEDHEQCLGVCQGYVQNPDIYKYILSCDCVLMLGPLINDLTTVSFKYPFPKSAIDVQDYQTKVDDKVYDIFLGDVIDILIRSIQGSKNSGDYVEKEKIAKGSLMTTEGFKEVQNEGETLQLEFMYYHLQRLVKNNDSIFVDVGIVPLGFCDAKLPPQAQIWIPGSWGSIGSSLVQGLGIQVAEQNKRRVVILIGEGAYQMTVQEIGTFQRYGLKPLIFVFNNDGYLIERCLNKYPDIAYNNLQQWKYSQLPDAFGCKDWLTDKISTVEQFMQMIDSINKNPDKAAYFEIILDKYAVCPYFKRFKINQP